MKEKIDANSECSPIILSRSLKKNLLELQQNSFEWGGILNKKGEKAYYLKRF